MDTNSKLYSCQNCTESGQTLVTFETGIKECIKDSQLDNCIIDKNSPNYSCQTVILVIKL